MNQYKYLPVILLFPLLMQGCTPEHKFVGLLGISILPGIAAYLCICCAIFSRMNLDRSFKDYTKQFIVIIPILLVLIYAYTEFLDKRWIPLGSNFSESLYYFAIIQLLGPILVSPLLLINFGIIYYLTSGRVWEIQSQSTVRKYRPAIFIVSQAILFICIYTVEIMSSV